MKQFIIAVVLGLILINCFGSMLGDWLGFHIMLGNEYLSPWENIVALSIIAVVFVIVGFIVAVSLAGTLIVGALAALVALFVVGVSAFWPILLLAGIVYALRRRPHALTD
ncbi:hypothetical protein OCL06_03990 [Alteromonas sp. ASW11-19]|uniref:Uncharacterized protein n=1 Tax=Alteromonas salexigens TaxID=2982530 RepID=A0ABT2VKF4_9ALTE|nr:hypothetical protein [Alteromonas salexigens]MCU7553758.1 hypothetical protein [Alteromonas salexigens]